MKKFLFFIVIIGLLHIGSIYAGDFVLKSNDLKGQITENQVFNGFGCSGKNISPALNWMNAPKDTKSFAITVYDPDAPTGSGWWHWVVFNIPANVTSLKTDTGNPEKNLAPEGSVQSITDYGKPGFGGACPPVGDTPHAYVFTVYALNVEKLGLDEKSSPALVGFMLNSHVISKASIVAYYRR